VPVCVVDPASTVTLPPEFFVPLPTVMLMAPPWPPVAVPLPIDRLPELPHDVVPELNTRAPLMPLVPAATVLIVNEPPVDVEPWPAIIEIAPPVAPAPAPAVSSMDPPRPLVPVWVVEPPSTVTLPPEFFVPLPTVMLISPPWPPVAVPLPIEECPSCHM